MSCGRAIRNGSRDWDLAFEFGFTDPAGFEAFAAHRAHDEFVERHVHSYADVVMSVDYDDEASA
jgi:stress responsive alpha/beta barrel protein